MDTTNTIIKAVVDSTGVYTGYGVVNRQYAVSSKPKTNSIVKAFDLADKIQAISYGMIVAFVIALPFIY